MPGKTSKIKLDRAFAKRDSATRSGLLPGGWWLWCVLGLAIGLTAWIGGRRYLRTELASQLASAGSNEQAIQSLDALLRLDGDAALDVSRALGHADFVVAHAAFRALNQQLDTWGQLEPSQRIARMAQLVSELERVPRESDQDHRILVTGLTSRIYAEALSSRDESAAQVLESCRRIMNRNAAAGWESTATNAESALAAGAGLATSESPSAPAAAQASDASNRDERASPTAAAAQSKADHSMPRFSSTAADPISPPPPVRVQLTGAPSRQATLVDRETPIRLSEIGDRASELAEADSDGTHDRTLRAAQPFDASGVHHPASQNHHAADEESRADQALAGIDNLTIDQLVRLLASVQPRVAQAAALSLRRKGMSDDKLDLAMQLAGGSSSERNRILQSLGQRDDLDARPWLLWMAADGDPAVREQAVGMLAPLLDQEVRRQLRLLLNKERDERVAQTIRRILMQ